MQYRCANCASIFSDKQAKCEDWTDPTKNFICPHCEVALMRTEARSVSIGERIKRVKPAHWIALVGFFLMLVLIDRRAGLPILFPYVATFLAALALVIHQWFKSSPYEHTETVDISLERSTDSNVYQFRPNAERDHH